jgi:hypothetical protein
VNASGWEGGQRGGEEGVEQRLGREFSCDQCHAEGQSALFSSIQPLRRMILPLNRQSRCRIVLYRLHSENALRLSSHCFHCRGPSTPYCHRLRRRQYSAQDDTSEGTYIGRSPVKMISSPNNPDHLLLCHSR